MRTISRKKSFHFTGNLLWHNASPHRLFFFHLLHAHRLVFLLFNYWYRVPELYQNDESRISVVVIVRLSVCPSPSIRRTESHTQQTSEERAREKIEGEGHKDEIDRDDATHRRGERKRTKSKDHLEIWGLVRALSNNYQGHHSCPRCLLKLPFHYADQHPYWDRLDWASRSFWKARSRSVVRKTIWILNAYSSLSTGIVGDLSERYRKWVVFRGVNHMRPLPKTGNEWNKIWLFKYYCVRRWQGALKDWRWLIDILYYIIFIETCVRLTGVAIVFIQKITVPSVHTTISKDYFALGRIGKPWEKKT